MTLLYPQNGAQTKMSMSFLFDTANGDAMRNVAGAVTKFGSTAFAATIFDIMRLPAGAVVSQVAITNLVPANAVTTISIGSPTTPDGYMVYTTANGDAQRSVSATPAASVLATALEGDKVRLSLVTPYGEMTLGKFLIEVEYSVINRQTEISPTK